MFAEELKSYFKTSIHTMKYIKTVLSRYPDVSGVYVGEGLGGEFGSVTFISSVATNADVRRMANEVIPKSIMESDSCVLTDVRKIVDASLQSGIDIGLEIDILPIIEKGGM